MSSFPGYRKILGSCLFHSGSPETAGSLYPWEQTSHFTTGMAAGSCSSKILWGFSGQGSIGLSHETLMDRALGQLRRHYWKGRGRGVRWSCQSHVPLEEWMNVYIMVQPVSQLSRVRKHSAHNETRIKSNTSNTSLCHPFFHPLQLAYLPSSYCPI